MRPQQMRSDLAAVDLKKRKTTPGCNPAAMACDLRFGIPYRQLGSRMRVHRV
jgi:hypothetical protein